MRYKYKYRTGAAAFALVLLLLILSGCTDYPRQDSIYCAECRSDCNNEINAILEECDCHKNEINAMLDEIFDDCHMRTAYVMDCRVDLCDPFVDHNEQICFFGHIDDMRIPYFRYISYSPVMISFYGFHLINKTECKVNYVYPIGQCPHNTSIIIVGGKEYEIC